VIEATIGLSFTLLLGTANTYLLAFFPLLLWGAGEKLANLGLSVAISQSDSREVRRNILTRRIFTFACFLLLTSQFPWTLVGFSYFLGASSVIGGIISAFRYRNFLTGIEFTNFRRIMLLGIPFQINSFLNQLRNMDVFILNQFVSSGVAGNYALALRFSQPVSIPLSALSQTGITSISAGIHSATVKFFLRYSSAFRYSFIAIIVVSLIPTSFVSSRFFTDYSGIGTTFKIQMIAFLLFGVIAVETAILQAVGRQNFVYKSAIIGILGNLIIIGLGGYHYGELGASAALLLGNFIQSFLLYRVRRQRIHPGE
jgi:O-antigen/teichoic acid export membrane protein